MHKRDEMATGRRFLSGSYRIIHTNATLVGTAGVGIILNKKFGSRVTYYKQYNEIIILITIKTRPVNTIIIPVYMLTPQHDDDISSSSCYGEKSCMRY